MTTALYRRYRPDAFADVIGQDHVTGPLRAALRANRMTHAYLFSGPRGCGKTTSARILARCLNCAEGPTDTPCGHCDSCRELATGGAGSLDVVEIDAASHGGVDDARELREKATFAPVRDRYKVFIIDEAHMVTPQGFNALLKLVEEPPEHVKFVFATTEPERVIGTIRSRTHHYPFRLVPPDVLGPYLQKLSDEEGIAIGAGVLPMVMRAGGGSVRDTLSVLDQLMAGSIDSRVSYDTAVALLGYTDTALLDESVDALAGGDGAAAYRVVERIVESGHDPRRFVEDLLQRLRDLLIIAVAGDGAGDVLADTPSDQLERMRHQAANWGPRALSRAADLTDEALRQMTGATSPRLQLELLLARILVPQGRPAAQPVDEVAMPGTVGTAGGGAPREDAPRGRFGAREAREALERSRGRAFERPAERAPERPAERDRRDARPEAPSRPEGALRADDAPERSAPSALNPEPSAEARGWPEVSLPAARPESPRPMEAPASPATPERREPASGRRPADVEGRAPDSEALADSSAPAPQPPAVRETEAPARPRGGQDADMVRGRWGEILTRLSAMSRVVWTLVSANAQLGAVDGSDLVLLFPTEAILSNFSRGGRADTVAEAVYEVTGVRVSVIARVGQASGGAAVSAPSALASDRAPLGESDWVSEPPPFDRSEPTGGERAPAPGTGSPLPVDEPVPAEMRSEHEAPRRGAAPSDLEPEDRAPARSAVIADPRESAPVPAEPRSALPVEDASMSDRAFPEDVFAETADAAPSDRPLDSESLSTDPVETPAGRTGAPRRRALSVFTYDDPLPPREASASSAANVSEPSEPETPWESASAPEDASWEAAPAPEAPAPEPGMRTTPPVDAPAPADAWGPVAVPGGAAPQDSTPWSPEPARAPETSWTPEPRRASGPAAPSGPSWGGSSSTGGWTETVSAPGGVSFDSDPAPGFGSAPADRPWPGAPAGTGAPTPAPASAPEPVFDDAPSLDDEDIEVSTRFGVPAVLDILGGTVIEEIYDEGTR